MKTLAEFLNNAENQDIVLQRMIDGLRTTGEWGKRGMFTRIGNEIGFSGAYVGQVFNKSKPLREKFVERMADHLCVGTDWLCGEGEVGTYKEEVDKLISEEEKQRKKGDGFFNFLKLQADLKTLEKAEKYKPLLDIFLAIPEKQRKEAIDVLSAHERVRKSKPEDLIQALESFPVTPPPAAEE